MGFDALYGLELTDCSDELVRGSCPRARRAQAARRARPRRRVRRDRRGAGRRGTDRGVGREGKLAVGLSNQTTSLHPIDGRTRSTRRRVRRHRGRTTWVWEVELSDDAERGCAVGRVTIAGERRVGDG